MASTTILWCLIKPVGFTLESVLDEALHVIRKNKPEIAQHHLIQFARSSCLGGIARRVRLTHDKIMNSFCACTMQYNQTVYM